MADNVACHPARLAQQRLALAVAALLGGTTAFGASVTSCADDGGFDTLRHAVLTANSGDTLDLSALGCSKITLASAIQINVAPLTIIGPGAGNLTIDGGHVDRVFVNTSHSAITLQDLTIANGTVAATEAYGGCVYSEGSVTLQRVVVNACMASGQVAAKGGGVFTWQDLEADDSALSNNVAIAEVGGVSSLTAGGAIYENGALTLKDSILSGNSAHTPSGLAYGGAASGTQVKAKYSTFTNNEASSGDIGSSHGGALRSATSILIVASTLDHNKADVGGAVSVITDSSGTAGILQSTLSSNTANTGLGGAITSNVDIEIDNSTIAFNDGPINSTAVWIANGSVTLNSTIIADNAQRDIDTFNVTLIGGGKNLVKIPGNSAILPGGTIKVDPNLGPLAYNGGRVRTHAIDATSPAFDAGVSDPSLTSDERGAPYARVVGAAADIGAFEFDADHIFGSGFESH